MDNDELERIGAPHDSKAAKIRAMNEAGVSNTDISTFLGIRYQYTYNVLLRAGRIVRSEEKASDQAVPLRELEGREDGSVVLPDKMLRSFDIPTGGRAF
jgi:hypothetical protein